jgi:hypothetical protein
MVSNPPGGVALESIAADAVRVLQQRMSVAPQKRQLATKVRRVVKGQFQTLALRKIKEALRLARIDIITVQAKIEPTVLLSGAWPR